MTFRLTTTLSLLGGALLCASLAACPAPAVNVDMTGVDSAGVTDMAAAVADLVPGPDLRRYRDMTPPPTATVKGVLLDEGAKPLGGVNILACSASDCLTGKTAGDGSFAVSGLKLVAIGVKAQEDTSNADPMRWFVEVIAPIKLTVADQTTDLMNVYQPNLRSTVAPAAGNSRQTLVIPNEGISLAFVLGDLDAAIGADTSKLGARRVPAERRPAFDVGTETVIGAWAMFPFATKSKGAPIGVSATLDSKLPAGAAVKFRSVSELDGTLGAPAAGTVQMDGLTVATDAGQGLTNLTWIIVSK